MFYKKQTPKSGHVRLQVEMASITDQTLANAKALRGGQPITPIEHAETETLFSEKNRDGETVYNHYHFTEDMSQLDPKAQVHLMQLFGQILAFNELMEHPGVETRLDWIAANACFFERYFARADFSSALLAETPEQDMQAQLQDILDADKARIKDTQATLFDPSQSASLLRQPIPLMVAVGKPYQEGQKFINGVYFSAEAAPAVMDWIASLQAAPAQDYNPAHA
ncbi:MAG: hypothetical protein HKN27_07205 [Silicimonas sp.]|nr:hypothetical protein [Silicimonas sp.]